MLWLIFPHSLGDHRTFEASKESQPWYFFSLFSFSSSAGGNRGRVFFSFFSFFFSPSENFNKQKKDDFGFCLRVVHRASSSIEHHEGSLDDLAVSLVLKSDLSGVDVDGGRAAEEGLERHAEEAQNALEDSGRGLLAKGNGGEASGAVDGGGAVSIAAAAGALAANNLATLGDVHNEGLAIVGLTNLLLGSLTEPDLDSRVGNDGGTDLVVPESVVLNLSPLVDVVVLIGDSLNSQPGKRIEKKKKKKRRRRE